MLVKMVRMAVMLFTTRSKMYLIFGAIGLIGLVGFAWFMPMPGLYGGDEFISDVFFYIGALFGGLAVIGYLEEK
jgi:hypothetical protein